MDYILVPFGVFWRPLRKCLWFSRRFKKLTNFNRFSIQVGNRPRNNRVDLGVIRCILVTITDGNLLSRSALVSYCGKYSPSPLFPFCLYRFRPHSSLVCFLQFWVCLAFILVHCSNIYSIFFPSQSSSKFTSLVCFTTFLHVSFLSS